MTRMLSMDPGKRTGLAVVHWSDDGPEVVVSTEVGGWLEAADALEALIAEHTPTVLVTEDFVILKKTSGQWSIKLNGVVEWLAHRHGLEMRGQNSALAKAFSSDEKLRALGMWHSGGRGHANDALRHALYSAVCEDNFRDRRMLG